MKNSRQWLLLLLIFKLGVIQAQETILKGRIVEHLSLDPIEGVKIVLQETGVWVYSNEEGQFTFEGKEIPLGDGVLVFEKQAYLLKKLSINVQQNTTIVIDPMYMEVDWQTLDTEMDMISLSEEELLEDDFTVASMPSVLQASKGVFEGAVAYDFSGAYFRPRGLDNSHNSLFINGMELSNPENGAPQWGLIGGLNDVQRNRDTQRGFRPHQYSFGSLGSTTFFTMRASRYRNGGSISYARANRSYQSRLMGSYHSGRLAKGWAYSILLSKRYGNTGFVAGTPYDASAFFVSIERSLGEENSLNLTAFYAPVQRGRSTPLTAEVLALKGPTYNPNWGFHNGRLRNSRMKEQRQPVVVLSHFGRLGSRFLWENHIGLTYGVETNSRIDNAGARNPYPHYYQRLPSYFLRNEAPSVYDYNQAYWAREALENDGQLSWEFLYETNQRSRDSLAKYVVMNDVSKNRQLQLKTVLLTKEKGWFHGTGSLEYAHWESEKFAQIDDLLGHHPYKDVDAFYDGNEPGFEQSNVETPNRLVEEGDVYKYHYKLKIDKLRGTVQLRGQLPKTNFYFGADVLQSTYRREGLFRNGYFQEDQRSLGTSETVSFFTPSVKAGISYRWNARHESNAHFLGGTRPPFPKNAFANVRQNNDIVFGLKAEQLLSANLNYQYTGRLVQIQLNSYYSLLHEGTEIGYFFTENALGLENNTAFVQEIVQGIGRRQMGMELGVKWRLLTDFSIKGALAVGDFIYTKNPRLYLAGDDFDYTQGDGFVEGEDRLVRGLRQVALKQFHQAVGPERAYQIGFEYRDPEYWWFGMTANFFSHSYVDPSFLRRSEDFLLDVDGLPYAHYDPSIARKLLRQERLQDFMLVNLVGGKSWKWGGYYVGLFGSVSNILNESFRTGGFEDSRYASYPQQLLEQQRPGGPLFGNRYFTGYGTTFFISLSLRF